MLKLSKFDSETKLLQWNSEIDGLLAENSTLDCPAGPNKGLSKSIHLPHIAHYDVEYGILTFSPLFIFSCKVNRLQFLHPFNDWVKTRFPGRLARR